MNNELDLSAYDNLIRKLENENKELEENNNILIEILSIHLEDEFLEIINDFDEDEIKGFIEIFKDKAKYLKIQLENLLEEKESD